jgi:hypothetical protein
MGTDEGALLRLWWEKRSEAEPQDLFSEEGAAEKYMPQLQHNMWVVAARTAVLSVITGGGKWV